MRKDRRTALCGGPVLSVILRSRAATGNCLFLPAPTTSCASGNPFRHRLGSCYPGAPYFFDPELYAHSLSAHGHVCQESGKANSRGRTLHLLSLASPGHREMMDFTA